MKKITYILLISLSISLLFFLSFKYSKNKNPLPDTHIRGDEQAIMSILYQQKAAEYRALCLQSYNIAKNKVDNQISKKVSKDTLLAVITDLDETALDNSANEVWLCKHNKTFEPSQFNEWCKLAIADSVPGSVSFFKYVDKLRDRLGRKIDIYYLSRGIPD